MTQGEMLKSLYDGVLKELEQSKIYLKKKDFAQVNAKLQKAQTIIKYLQNTLDFKYDISNNLNSLYDYFIHIIVQANTKKDSLPLDDIIPMIKELRDAYIEADKSSRSVATQKTVV